MSSVSSDSPRDWTGETAGFIGHSCAMRALVEGVAQAARSDAKVLITGESGVGKEIAARQVHSRSHRRRAPLVTLNCAGLPDTLLESELFGHARGSFTGAVRDKPGLLETADTGTVFLDEVGEMSLRMQAVVLRFLETGEVRPVGSVRCENRVDVRVIAATNGNLLQMVRDKAFRPDLYYRLNVIHLTIPPLRERREDIPVLVEHYLHGFSVQYGVPESVLSAGALECLRGYDWPGNVRELKNIVERIVVTSEGAEVGVDDLPADVREITPLLPPQPMATTGSPSAADEKFEAMVRDGESFWSAVYGPFIARDITREDVRKLVARGLRRTAGNYRMLVALFNVDPSEYRRFLNFLRKHDCHMAYQSFRSVEAESDRAWVLSNAS